MLVSTSAGKEIIITTGSEKAQEVKAALASNLLNWLSQPGMSKHETRIMSVIDGIVNADDSIIQHATDTNKEIIVYIEESTK